LYDLIVSFVDVCWDVAYILHRYDACWKDKGSGVDSPPHRTAFIYSEVSQTITAQCVYQLQRLSEWLYLSRQLHIDCCVEGHPSPRCGIDVGARGGSTVSEK